MGSIWNSDEFKPFAATWNDRLLAFQRREDYYTGEVYDKARDGLICDAVVTRVFFKQLRDELRVSILYITHDLATAYYVSDRIAIMFRGNIIEMGTVVQVLINPRLPYTHLLHDSIQQAVPKKRWKDTVNLMELEQEEYLRRGCKFAGRCPHVMDICRQVDPPDVQVEQRKVKCYLYTEHAP